METNGARGGVYYEAGFAHGLGLEVIFSCRKGMVKDKLHFDTRQYYHIVWETPDDLRIGLLNRIRSRIGDGPGQKHRFMTLPRPRWPPPAEPNTIWVR